MQNIESTPVALSFNLLARIVLSPKKYYGPLGGAPGNETTYSNVFSSNKDILKCKIVHKHHDDP